MGYRFEAVVRAERELWRIFPNLDCNEFLSCILCFCRQHKIRTVAEDAPLTNT